MTDEGFIGFIEQVAGDTHLKVEENLGSGYVRLRSAEAERRQAKHDIRCVEDIIIEMLRNARDAKAKNVFIASTRDGTTRYLTILDDGVGIPDDMQQLVFEPRVTSKLETMVMDDWGVHGRGMALYSIRCNADEAKVIYSHPGMGASFTISVDTAAITEKADQSTYPKAERDDAGDTIITTGPHNIIRTALEFALAHRRELQVYLGSPSEIAATMAELGHKSLKRETLLFCDDITTLPICQRLAACADASEFVNTCVALGLDISERTAHRILSRQIEPLRPLIDKVIPTRQVKPAPAIDLMKDNRGLKLSQEDIQSFARALEQAFEPLAERYYLSLKDIPKIAVKGDAITVRFFVDKDI